MSKSFNTERVGSLPLMAFDRVMALFSIQTCVQSVILTSDNGFCNIMHSSAAYFRYEVAPLGAITLRSTGSLQSVVNLLRSRDSSLTLMTGPW